MTVLVISILAVWLILSAINQLKVPALESLRVYDIFALLPNWSFFAPRPGTFDYHLLFRDRDSSGRFGGWQEIPLANQRTLWGAVWNPQKRNTKVLTDAVQVIASRVTRGSITAIPFSIPYLTVLNYISHISCSRGSTHTQFMVLRSEGFLLHKDPELVFLSHIHRL